jgi:hypothetical protein
VKLHASLNQVSQFGKLSQLLVKNPPTGGPTWQEYIDDDGNSVTAHAQSLYAPSALVIISRPSFFVHIEFGIDEDVHIFSTSYMPAFFKISTLVVGILHTSGVKPC